MDGSSMAARGAVVSASPISPASSRFGSGGGGGGGGGGTGSKRKRSSGHVGAERESSPGSYLEDEHVDVAELEKKRQPGVKRACNECRQQKLRCDVVQDPFQGCTRCKRLNLECKIESTFKRIGKRSKHAEMEREIERLRHIVALAHSHGFHIDNDDHHHTKDDDDDDDSPLAAPQPPPHPPPSAAVPPTSSSSYGHTRDASLMGSDEAVSSLLRLKRGGSYSAPPPPSYHPHQLNGVCLTHHEARLLFDEFFTRYHPFLPFLDPSQDPDQYKHQHALLFWSIVAVAARCYTLPSSPDLLARLTEPLTRHLWTTIGEVPNNHYIIKAMCLLCTWPLPTSTTSSDPTHILCGVMMKSATGIGLHRPYHSRDFSRVPVELDHDQLRDRITTWAVCNIVAQNVATGYGQPASTLYDWTLAPRPGDESGLQLSPELEARLQIERFCDKVSKEMYSNASDPRGVAGDEHRAMLMCLYRRDYAQLQAAILSQPLSFVVKLHLRAAGLHMRLAGFFDSSTTPGYMNDLMGLWRAATSFLDDLFEVESMPSLATTNNNNNNTNTNINMTTTTTSSALTRDHKRNRDSNRDRCGPVLLYATNYLKQMLIVAVFTLLKLMRSFFRKTIDLDRGRHLFHHSIRAIRTTSVVDNDLQWRLAELMAQMYNGSHLDRKRNYATCGVDDDDDDDDDDDSAIRVDDSLQLKVRCRHSMSLVFDSVWRWREEYQSSGRGSLENMKHPTNPDSANDSSATSSQLDTGPMPSHNTPSSITASTSAAAAAAAAAANTAPLASSASLASIPGGNLLVSGGPNGALTPGCSALAAAAAAPGGLLGGFHDATAGAGGGPGGGGGGGVPDFFDPNSLWMLDGLVEYYDLSAPEN